jgi:hypothetical protein
MNSLETLLRGLIDYAGLFPPAELGMAATVANYRQYLGESHAWMLGRLIVPAQRLVEFEEAARELGLRGSNPPWRLSALVPASSNGTAFSLGLQSIREFNARQRDSGQPLAWVDTIEGKADSAAEIDEAVGRVAADFELFLELPAEQGPRWIEYLANSHPGARAKIRTGGVTAAGIPPVEQVARFLLAAVKNQVGFKATAGLHHPLRGEYPLTYRADSPRAVMHGFLNLFVAACAITAGFGDESQVTRILRATRAEPSLFQFHSDRITFQDLVIPAVAVEQTRSAWALSFGSCSFCEPVDDLHACGFLGPP